MSKIETKLPEGYFVQENRIRGPRGFEANGTFCINSYYSDIDCNGKSNNKLSITFYIGMETPIVTIPISDLTECKISKHIPVEFIVSVSDRQKCRFIVNTLKINILDIVPQKRYIMMPGFNFFENHVIFALGDKLLTDSDCCNIITYSPYKLKNYGNNKNNAYWTIIFASLGSRFPALLVSSCFSYVKPLIQNSGLQGDIDFSIIYTGETSTCKTEIIKLLVGLFEENENFVSLSSEKEAIYKLSKFKNCNVFIDDLCATDSERFKKSNEEKVSRILQQKSSDGSITYKGENARIESTIFLTAEYTPKNHSTINRCLIVYASEINMDTLTWLQENQSMYIEFITDFIRWICCNYNDLLIKIKNYTETFTVFQEIDSSVYSGVNRIKRTELGLRVTLMLFFNFIYAHTYGTTAYNKLLRFFENSIKECISDTLNLLKKESDKHNTDYIKVILDKILNMDGNTNVNAFVAMSYKDYNRSKKTISPALFFLHDDFLCITGTDLLNIFENADGFEYKFSKKSISEQLNYFGILQPRGGEYSYPIDSINNKTRYYYLRPYALKEFLDGYHEQAISYNDDFYDIFYKKGRD